jgi:hypothetical protein
MHVCFDHFLAMVKGGKADHLALQRFQVFSAGDELVFSENYTLFFFY